MTLEQQEKAHQAVNDFTDGKITKEEAFQILVKLGDPPAFAREILFMANGGSDCVMIDSHTGKRRYYRGNSSQ